MLADTLRDHQITYGQAPQMAEFRAGDVRHSLADVSKARQLLGYKPTHRIGQGLIEAMPWYIQNSCPQT
jgi:UDP-N-acetylglucosamine 4-epimerase